MRFSRNIRYMKNFTISVMPTRNAYQKMTMEKQTVKRDKMFRVKTAKEKTHYSLANEKF